MIVHARTATPIQKSWRQRLKSHLLDHPAPTGRSQRLDLAQRRLAQIDSL